MPAILIFRRQDSRVTFEYSLVHGVNDTEEDAKELIGTFKAEKLSFESDSGESGQESVIL